VSRLMSVAMTTDAVIEQRKTVTRRKGWWVDKNGRCLLKPGDRLTLCRKVMGRKAGEPLVRERLIDLDWKNRCDEVAREGFPGMDPWEFIVRYFIEAQGIHPMDDVTRIEWRYLGEESA
jgi:hypothetical protein